MGLFEQLENAPVLPEEEVIRKNPNSPSLEAPSVTPETPEELMVVAKSTRERIEQEEGPTTKQIIAGLTAEIAISGGGQAASAVAAGGTASTIVGAAAAPFVWVGGTFSSGYAGSVTAQNLEKREKISQGRALFAGLINTIPFLGKARQGSKLAKLTKELASHASQGAAIGAGEMTSIAVIDEGRLPTLGELGLGAGGGAVIGTALGGTIEGGKVLAPKTVELFKKISGKTADEIDVMVAKGDVLAEDIAEAMDDIAEAPKPKPEPQEAPETPKGGKATTEQLMEESDLAHQIYKEKQGAYAKKDAGFGVPAPTKTTDDKLWKESLDEARKRLATKEAPETPKDTPEPTPAPKKLSEIREIINQKGAIQASKETGTFPQIDTPKDYYKQGNVYRHIDDPDFKIGDLDEEGLVRLAERETDSLLTTEATRPVNQIKQHMGPFSDPVSATKALNENAEALKPIQEAHRKLLREKYGDTVTVYRAEDPDFTPNADREVSSWSLTKENAEAHLGEGGVVKEKRISVDDVEFLNNHKETEVLLRDSAPTAASKADPTSASGDALDESIAAVKSILEGDRTGGKGARVTRRVKRHFRVVAKEFMGDINDLLKNKDIETAKKILGRIDKYIEFDRAVSKKDYAQGSELQANSRNAMDNGTTDYAAGITAAGNKRTEDLNVLKGMLQKLVDEDVAIDPKVAKQVAKDTKKNAEGAPKLSKEEKLDAIADQVAKTFTGERTGVFQQAIDGYFTVRLTQMLNQAKTAFVGVPSATFMSVVRPIINTPYNVRKSLSLEGVTLSRRVQYAAADISATYEYVRMITKHLGDTLRSSRDTILNKGDSNFLYRDRNAYIKDQLAEANEVSHVVKRRLKQAQRREAARNAKTETGRRILNAKATVMNSKIAQVPAFFFDYGVSLIGGLEEISLIAHSMRAARAQGIKKGIDEGVDDVWKFSEEYMESAFDRSRGSLQAKYDPEFADIFNTARRDHFRAMDLDPNDIRKDLIDGIVAAMNRISGNPDEMGLITRMLYVFIGVPLRAGGANLSYIASPYNVAKNVAGGGARRVETALGGTATFGKYNKKISELELDIKEQKTLLKSQDADVAKTAEKKLAELEESLAFTKDLKMQKDYEDLGKLAVGAGLFFLVHEMAKNGQVAGTDSWMTEEQKLATQKVQGAPNSWKVVFGGSEYDFKYFEPLKGVAALAADYARWQAARDAGSLTEDQTPLQFATSVATSLAADSPFSTGLRYTVQMLSPNPDTQERGAMGVARSLIPVPAEVRNFNKFDEEFVTDTTSGEFFDTILSASIGQETGNYRLTVLGEPKLKEEPSIASYLIPFGPKTVPEREPIDDILLEDAMSFRSVSSPQTSISGFKLKNYVNSDNETLYSLYGRLITETKIGGKSQRQALNALVKTPAFKRAYKEGYVMNEQGTEVNEGIEMIKEIISEYRAVARDKILNTKSASEYTDSDGNNIYDVLKEREQFSERPESLLENLNLK